MNFGVKKGKKDNINSMLRRFKKLTKETGIIEEYKERQFYLKPSEKKYKERKLAQRKRLFDKEE